MAFLGPLKLRPVASGKRGRSTTDPVKWAHIMPLIRDAVTGPKRKMTQSELAEKMHLSASAISQWFREGGGNRPDPWNTLLALEIVGAPISKVREHFYGYAGEPAQDELFGNLAKALGIDVGSLATLGSDPALGRVELMGQSDEIRRAALAVMVAEERTLSEVTEAARVARDAHPGAEKDCYWWINKISGALKPSRESGQRPSVRALQVAKKV